MRSEIREAIESARSIKASSLVIHHAKNQRRMSFDLVRAVVFGVLENLPEDFTVRELLDELNIQAVQEPPHD